MASARSDGSVNARVLDQSGSELRRLGLGDCIEHIKIDESGLIWVGWFDQGVIGNKKWSYPGYRWHDQPTKSFRRRGSIPPRWNL